MPRRLLVCLILLAGCKGSFGRYCENDQDCTDPNYPICDLTGASAESGGHGRICVSGTTSDAGTADADESVAPAPPALVSPRSGAYTGSVWAESSLRPLLRWQASANATSYEVQLDDSCPAVNFGGCTFDSPEEQDSVATLEYRPATPLAVSMTAPVGRRYFWHVRACNLAGCSDWSPARYVNVGRQASDYNGDGYADRVVGVMPDDQATAQVGAAYIYFGKAALTAGDIVTTADVTLQEPTSMALDGYGRTVASIGDTNADGFGDIVVGAPGQRAGNGAAYLYLGRANWPGTVTQESTTLETVDTDVEGFGSVVSGGGDVNGDGLDDYLMAAPILDDMSTASSKAWLYLGRPSSPGFLGNGDVVFLPSLGNLGFGLSVDCGGDINGDGLADVAIGHPAAGAVNAGSAIVYFGRTTWTSPLQAADVQVDNPNNQPGFFGASVSVAGDVNGDGLADLVIGDSSRSNPEAIEGNVYLLLGKPSWPALAPVDVSIDNPGDRMSSYFGTAISSSGDVDGDGIGDIVVGAPTGDDEGEAFVYLGRATWAAQVGLADVALPNPLDAVTGRFGLDVTANGDVNGDGFDDIAVGAPSLAEAQSREGKAFYWLGRASWPLSLGSADVELRNPVSEANTYFGRSID